MMRGKKTQTLRGKVRRVVSNYAENLKEAKGGFCCFILHKPHKVFYFGLLSVATGPCRYYTVIFLREQKASRETYMGVRKECRMQNVAISEDQYSQGRRKPRITDCLNALTPGDVYLFTTNGPSLKSHRRRNRLNAGPGETWRRQSIKEALGSYSVQKKSHKNTPSHHFCFSPFSLKGERQVSESLPHSLTLFL